MRLPALLSVIVLLTVACSSAPVTAGPPHTPGVAGVTDPAEVTVDLFQSDQLVGRINVRSTAGGGDFVRLLVQMPIVPDQDYRLDSLMFEFRTDVIQPQILLQPANGTLTEEISFRRIDSAVRFVVPDTGAHGDGTVLFEFLVGRDAFGSSGLRLHVELQLNAGDAETDLVILPAP